MCAVSWRGAIDRSTVSAAEAVDLVRQAAVRADSLAQVSGPPNLEVRCCSVTLQTVRILDAGAVLATHPRSFDRAREPCGQAIGQQAEGGVAFGTVPASDSCPARGLARV